MKRKIAMAAFVLVGALNMASVADVQAVGGGTYCGDTNYWNNGQSVQHPGYFYLVLYWNGSYGGNCIGFNSSQTNLTNWTRFDGRSWNDQVSSFKFIVTGTGNYHYHLSQYVDSNYSGCMLLGDYGCLEPNLAVGGYPLAFNDDLSSVKIIYQ